MRYSAIDAARVWVGEQLRYPQRIPRTTTVLDWSAIPWTLQRRLEDVARASGTIDFGSLPRRRWFSTRSALSASDHTTVASASTMLHCPTHADTDETRIVTLAEGVVDRTASHPAWTIPAVGGRRSVIGLHMELHAIAAAANELLTLRSSTPDLPTAADVATQSREEWNRRQVLFAQSRSALSDRVAALRVVEDALDRVHSVAEELRTVQRLSADTHLAEQLHQQMAGAELAAADARTAGEQLEEVEQNLRAQVDYLDTLVSRTPRP
ncbi:hypothetical protein [Prescottella equi]|uniref:hypothetical protein n=1 Tax=Rhodococcus hoagii TaxID=43767 RepID=UPI001EEB9EC9|nr:hypothetical protein [Prescottella equi]